MPKNTMTDLRNHLFETLEALKDDDKPMPLDRAKAVVEVAQQIINSAKVEVDFLDVVGKSEAIVGGSSFFEGKPIAPPQPKLIAGGRP